MRINRKLVVETMAKKRMSQTELAKRSGLSRQSVNMILARGTCVSTTLGKLSDGLGVSAAELAEIYERV